MTFELNFKKALHDLPDAEKDKLILRLLRRDLKLAKRLQFELIDNESIEEKRNELEKQLIQRINLGLTHNFSVDSLLQELRNMSGMITEHLFVTKDKFGEISLNLKILNQILTVNSGRIQAASPKKSYSLCIYIIARIYKVLVLMQKLHEDLLLDFKDDLENIGNLIGSNDSMMHIAIKNGLDVNWLIHFNIPDNMDTRQKELRAKGFLR